MRRTSHPAHRRQWALLDSNLGPTDYEFYASSCPLRTACLRYRGLRPALYGSEHLGTNPADMVPHLDPLLSIKTFGWEGNQSRALNLLKRRHASSASTTCGVSRTESSTFRSSGDIRQVCRGRVVSHRSYPRILDVHRESDDRCSLRKKSQGRPRATLTFSPDASRLGLEGTFTGTFELVAVPSPSWLYSLSPQQ